MVHLPLYQFPIDTGVFGALMSSPYVMRRFLSNLSTYVNRRLSVKTMRYTRYPIDRLRAICLAPVLRELNSAFFR